MDNSADPSSHPFRDGTAGAEAKRLKLLRDRRDELATMSHEIRQIYVRRFSRLLAGIALALGGSVIVAASLDYDLAESLASLLPGENPAALSTALLATWLFAGFALFSGRAWAERRFAVAMSKVVLPTEELHTDVSRLSYEDPATVGRNITRRLVPPARMVSVLAAGLIVPLTAMAAYLVVKAGGYPLVDDVEELFAAQSTSLMLIAGMSLAFALRLAFTSNWQPSFLTALGAAVFFPGVFVAAPSMMPAVLGGSAILVGTAYLGSRRRNKEDAKIEQHGAPVPPVVHFRKRLRQLVAAIWSVTALLRFSTYKTAALRGKVIAKRCLAFRPSLGQWMSGAVLIGASLTMFFVYTGQQTVEANKKMSAHTPSTIKHIDTTKTPVSYSDLRLSEDSLDQGAVVDFVFINAQPVDASEHLQGAFIPSGWSATVTVTRLQGDGRWHVEALDQVNTGSTTRQLSDSTPEVSFERTNCSGMDAPLLFHVTPYGDEGLGESTATLRYDVKMQLISGC